MVSCGPKLGLSFGNLLNPTVTRIQDNAKGELDRENPANTGFFDQGPIDVLSYNKGVDMSLGFTYKFSFIFCRIRFRCP